LTICPCCGFKFHGALSSGCKECGARAVGEPLPRPAHELPSYGRSLVLAASGSLVVLVFVVQTLIAYFQRFSDSLGFWNWVGAAETAAWRLKWISIPVLLITVTLGRKLYRSVLNQPEKFCGVNYARRGLLASSLVVLLIALLIGVTVPARLEQRQRSKDAAILAQWYTIERALVEYRIKYNSYPSDLKQLRDRIEDPYGELDEALAGLHSKSYNTMVEVAVVTTEKPRRLGGVAIRNASLSSSADDATPGGLAFTTYVLRLPGEDKIFGNEDDWVGRDGMIMKISNVARGGVGSSVSAGALQP
jgi:competence protein ComGC